MDNVVILKMIQNYGGHCHDYGWPGANCSYILYSFVGFHFQALDRFEDLHDRFDQEMHGYGTKEIEDGKENVPRCIEQKQ